MCHPEEEMRPKDIDEILHGVYTEQKRMCSE